jgi:hypothetical protein
LGPGSIVIGWALRWVLLCCGIVFLGVGLLDRGAALLPDVGSPADRERQAAISAPRASAPPSNTIAYTADEQGSLFFASRLATAAGRPAPSSFRRR